MLLPLSMLYRRSGVSEAALQDLQDTGWMGPPSWPQKMAHQGHQDDSQDSDNRS